MPFLLDGNPSQGELSEAINYLLSNFSQTVNADSNTGQISGPTGEVVGYLYRYLSVKYADSFDGSVNFSNTPTNRSYYGIRNSDASTESSNPADYIWTQVTGGFGTTKFFWYQTNGGRQIQIQIAVNAPDVSWTKDDGAAIDLDIVSTGNVPVVVESFVSYFAPPVLQVPRSGLPLTPVLTGISPTLYATDKGEVIAYSGATSDTSVAFTNNTWRIGNSSTTSFGDISYTNITVGDPTDAGDYAVWPNPSAMANSPAYITVPIRYKNSLGDISQASVANLQLIYADPGAQGLSGSSIDISGYTSFVQSVGGTFTPTNATLSALITNVTSPTYSWAISGATPTSSTSSSVVVTPTSSSTSVTVTLTVNGSNLGSPISKTINMPVVYDGVPGSAGANGLMSAFPSIYKWSVFEPTRPSTTSTYTWSTGAYTAPSGWSTTVPSYQQPGYYLWSITVPLTVSATTTTSTLDWTNTSNPVKSISYNGAVGVNGVKTAILQMYKWSASVPTTFPSGTSTYTWATGTFTAPATTNGWSLTPPAAVQGQTLYSVQQIYTSNVTNSTDIVTWAAASSNPISLAGTTGSNGTRTAVLQMYKWSAITPTTFPSGSTTYTWATGTFTAPSTTNGWSLSPGTSAPGTTLYAVQQIYTDTTTSNTSTFAWTSTTPISIGYAGENGVNGSDAYILFLTSSAQTFTFDGTGAADPTSQTISFTANLQNLTGTATFLATRYNSAGASLGTVTLGGSGNTRNLDVADFGAAAYCIVTASLSGYSDTTTVVRLQNGASGTNGTNGVSPIVGLLTNEAAVVAASSSGVVYDFSSAGGSFKVYEGITDVTSSASFSVSSSTNVTISINAAGVYTVTGLTALDGTAVLQAVYGSVYINKVYSISKSVAGTTGPAGTAGTSGSATFVVVRADNDSSPPTDAEVIAVINRTPVAGDIVTVNYNYGNNAVVYRFTTSWVTQATYLTGNLIVDGTVTASKLSVSQLSAINANLGNITAGDLSIGSSPTISGTTMTGSGAHLYSNGNMVVGNPTNNINWNGSQLTINGGDVILGSSPTLSGTTMTGTGAHLYSSGNMVVGNSSKNLNWNGTNLTINGNIVTYGNIVSNSATSTLVQGGSMPNNVYQTYWLYMDHAGVASIVVSGYYNFSGGSGTATFDVGIGDKFSTGPTVPISWSYTWSNTSGPVGPPTIQFSNQLAAGDWRIWVRISNTAYTTGYHNVFLTQFASYR
jgi:hypothetical protein